MDKIGKRSKMEVDLLAHPYTFRHTETNRLTNTNTLTHTQTHRIINYEKVFGMKDLIILRKLLLIIEYFGRTWSHLFK